MTPTCTLTVTSGPAEGTEVEVERELIIGRREADLTIPDPELSRRHAAVRPVEAGVVVEDLGSLNGTFVDGERISGPVTLTAATVRVGCSELSLKLATTAAEPEPEGRPEDGARTRLATAIPQEPVAIPQPQVTRVRPIPSAEPQGAEPSAAAAGRRAPIPRAPSAEQEPVADPAAAGDARARDPERGAAGADAPERRRSRCRSRSHR